MIIALACEENRIATRFVSTQCFEIYEIASGQAGTPTVAVPAGGNPAFLLRDHAVDLVICGKIGRKTQQSLLEEGIKFFGGVSGRSDQTLTAYLDGTLELEMDFTDHEEE